MILWLLKALGFARAFLNFIVGLAKKYPTQAALIVAVVASCWLWRGKQHAIAERDAARAEVVAIMQASEANRKAAEAQVAAIQLQYDQSAQEAQHEYETQLAAARGSLSDYVRNHRLPRQAGNQCAPTGTGEGSNPAVPSEVPSVSGMVAVKETDLQALVDWLAVGVEAHNHAVDKIERGVAIPDPAFGK